MNISPLLIPDVLMVQPKVFRDDRGFFFESFNQRDFEQAIGYPVHFVQDNHSCSIKNVVRGLHYQINQAQGKLIRVSSGAIFDVVVDLRKKSPTFGCWVGELLTVDNFKQLWIPVGCAHGFAVMSDFAEIQYKATDFWAPEHERCIKWDDTTLNIEWPLDGLPVISLKDQNGTPLKDAEVFA